MALETVEKIVIIVHADLQDEVVDLLTRLGTVHLARVTDADYLDSKMLTEAEADSSRQYQFGISQIEFLLGFLKENSREKSGFVKSMIKDKYPMTIDEFFSADDRIDLERTYEECSDLEQKLIDLRERRDRLEQETEELEEWSELDVPTEELSGGRLFEVSLVRVMTTDLEPLRAALADRFPESEFEKVSEVASHANCILVYYRPAEKQVQSVLSSYDLEHVSLPPSELTPEALLERLRDEQAGIEKQREEILDEVQKYQVHVPDLEVLRELLAVRRQKVESMTSFGITDRTVVVEGWVTEEGAQRTREALADTSEEISVEVVEPDEEDTPPVSLKNSGFFKPFELLTRLYGIPNNREYDPTWIIAISFIVFFGFCIGDVGYGLVIIIAFLLMRKYLPLGKNTRDLLLVLVYGGVLAMVVGVITGSWFGYDPEKLPQFMQSLAVFDPLNEPIPIMGVCMGLGLLHMLGGTAVEFRDNWRARNYVDALIEQGLVLFFFIGTIVAAILLVAGLVPTTAVVAVAGLALLGMIVFLGHKARSVPGKVFGGIYETYNTLVGWMGDIVSYVRLFALGLATFAVGWVINILGGMVMGIGFGIGILLMVVVILVGHTFNVTVNLLGAFVHPLRLEYVEFFSKFYEDGGDPFEPLGIDSKTVIIEKREA